MNAIEIIDFTKRYRGGKLAVKDLDLSVSRGSFFGLVGPNGAGKSTLVNFIAGMIRQSGGSLKIFDAPVREGDYGHKRRMGVVLEQPLYLDLLTGTEYLHFAGRLYGLEHKAVRERTGEILDVLDMGDAGDSRIRSYSSGMKKKLSIAAAIIHDPDLLILDEPFEGIDAVSSNTIRKILDRMAESGRTIFLTSHILHIVESLCEEVAIMHRGSIVFSSPSARIRETFKDGELRERYRDLEELFLDLVGGKQDRIPSWLE